MRTALAIAVCGFVIGCSADRTPVHPSDRSWTTGTVTVTPTRVNGELGVNVEGRWPDVGDGLWIRYELWLAQSGSPDLFLIGSTGRLTAFQKGGTGVSDYSGATDFARWSDPKRPYRAVFDYEIWRGEPTKGELLAKDSVWSAEIGPRATP